MVAALRGDGKPVQYGGSERGHGMGYWGTPCGAARDRAFPATLPGRAGQPLRPARSGGLGLDAGQPVGVTPGDRPHCGEETAGKER